MIKIITIVGTSLFYNHEKLKDSGELAKLENASSASAWDTTHVLKTAREEFTSLVRKSWKNTPDASSEIKSILAIAADLRSNRPGEPIEVYLLATDTIVSRLAAELIVEWFEKFRKEENYDLKFNYQLDVIKGLQVEELSNYKQGLTRLVERLYLIIRNDLWAFSQKDVCINITGGYKGIIPFLTILGQINRIRVCYIFEDTDTLLTIPPIPIQLDESLFEKYWLTFQKLDSETLLNRKDFYEFTMEAESCIEIDEQGNFMFNSLGLALWERYKTNFFTFYANHHTWDSLQKQTKVFNFFNQSFIDPALRLSLNVSEGTHKTVCKKFSDTPRIYWFEQEGKVYIYQSFENHDAHERYINAVKFNDGLKQLVIQQSSIQKIKINHV